MENTAFISKTGKVNDSCTKGTLMVEWYEFFERVSYDTMDCEILAEYEELQSSLLQEDTF